jgi:hypothetical protein
MKALLLALVAVCSAPLIHAQPNPRPPGGGSTPRDHEVHSATSRDGLTWTRDEGIRLKSASVPCAINDGDKRILLYVVRPPSEPGGVGGISCAVSTDGTNFTINRDFRIEGLSTLTAADPSIVKDNDGKFRLYYLASNHRGDPAHDANPHKINYAISDDGLRFREAGTAFTYDDLVDPDVFQFKGRWFMYVHARGTIIATSPDGKNFTYNKRMSPEGWGTTAPVLLPDGRLRLYAFEQRVPVANAVGSFLSTDGLNWTAEPGQRLKANPGEQITDPFVIPWRGGWKMYFKHSPARMRNVAGNPAQNPGGQINERSDNQTSGRTDLPLPKREGRGEGEQRAQRFQAPNNFIPRPPPQTFNNPDGPWNRDVIAYRVSAGGAVEKAATFERAGVPTLARLKDGRLIVAFQHFPADDNRNFDRVAVCFSSDEGRTWTAPQPITVEGMEAGLARPFDPTLVPLPDGRVRLYFTSNRSPDFRRSTPAIYSAISTDAIHYTFEPGVRFAVEGRLVIDCAVVLHNGTFHLYVPDNGTAEEMFNSQQRRAPPRSGTAYHATSTDGLNFTRQPDVRIEGRRRWLGNAQSDGKLITFYGTGENSQAGNLGGPPRDGLWMATSEDGQNWKLTPNPPINGADPGAVTTRDGGLLLVTTSSPVRNVMPSRVGAVPRDGRDLPPHPQGEGRGEGERLEQNFQPQRDQPESRDPAPRPPQRDGPRNQPPSDRGASGTPPAPQEHYAKVNTDSEFTPPRGGVSGPGPAPMRLMIATSRDGLNFERKNLIVADQGAVPDLVVDSNGWIWLYYQAWNAGGVQNPVAVALSKDNGASWTFRRTRLEGFERAKPDPCDPEIQLLPDGTFRLYTTWPGPARHPVTWLCESRDGVNFQRVGVAFAPEGAHALDPSVLRIGDTWHLFAGGGRGPEENWHATSPDGRTFTTGQPRRFNAFGMGVMMANGIAVPDGWRFYGFNNKRPGRPHRIVSFFTRDGKDWSTDDGARLEATGGLPALEDPSAGPHDPAIGRLKDGTYFMIYVARIPGLADHRPNAPPPGGPPRQRRDDGPRDEPPRAASEFIPPPAEPREPSPARPRAEIRVERVDSRYKAAQPAKPGTFATGQDADLVLGAKGFNNAGGPLLFNHPSGLATDGKALLVADRWNNRVLLWKSAPAKNTPPDLVLGQPDFTQNDPGTGKHQLNWPGNVAITPDGKRIAVTDTDNDRILIWNSFPTKNGAPADVVLELPQLSGGPLTSPRSSGGGEGARRAGEGERRNQNLQPQPRNDNQRPGPEGAAVGSNFRPQVGRGIQRFSWPWGVWTDGTRLAVVATHGSAVLIWNSLPTRDHQPPDLVLRPDGAGTPRNLTSDGKTFFAVSDHNYGDRSRPATMVWNSFPAAPSQQPDWTWREWVKGSFTPGGGLVLAGIQSIYLWNKPPRDAETDADVILRPATFRNGDGPDAVVANGRLYVCTYNGNHILGWNTLPTRDNQPPDFALGSDRTDQDTWAENFFIQNPVVATDGKSLFVTSDFDRKMFVWRNLPDESAAKPDLVMHLPDGPWDNELHGSTLALAGKNTVSVWRKLPLNGEPPDVTLRGRIGSAELGELTGVAFDDKFFYLADRRAESIRVWRGIPSENSEPVLTLPMRSPGRLTSDGNYLCAAPFEGGSIQLWRVSELSSRAEPITLGGRGQFNLPSECLIADGRLFVCNRSYNRVDVWHRVEDALAGRPADALLGASDERDRQPAIGRNQLFMPGSLAWDGSRLWVGEFKFSTRILRFTPQSKRAIGDRS